MLEVHVVVIDTVFGITVLLPLDDEREVVNLYVAYPEAEIAAALLLLVREAVHNLLDVHHTLGRLTQIELRIAHLAVTQNDARAVVAQARHVELQTTHIQQRIFLIILDIKPIHTDTSPRAETYAVDRDGGLQLARKVLHGAVHHKVLNRRQRDEQREHDGAKYQKQNSH